MTTARNDEATYIPRPSAAIHFIRDQYFIRDQLSILQSLINKIPMANHRDHFI